MATQKVGIHLKKYGIKKLPILLFHTDIFFDPIYLDNIVKSPKDNIIGIHSNNKIYKKKSIFVYTDKNQLINELNLQKKDYIKQVRL